MTGLGDAHAYLNGARDGFAVHEVKITEPNVVAIRGKTGLLQPAIAKIIGVLLALIEKQPSIVQEELGR